MIPPFDVEGGLTLALARAVSVAGLGAASGSLFYARVLCPGGVSSETTDRLRLLCFWSLSAAVAGALVWLLAQTLDLAGDASPADLWAVLAHTQFGRLLSARLLLLASAAIARQLRLGLAAAALACIALILQAGHSHAAAMGGSPVLLASSVLHLLAAGIWLGGLPGLWIVVSGGSLPAAHAAARRFSRAGVACVVILAATAAWQFSDLVAGLPGLVGTAYGWAIGIKGLLFAVLVALAARNNVRLTPALLCADGSGSRRALARAVAAECAVGLMVVAAAGVLTELQPAMHIQPVWPFAERFSLAAIDEDADVRREVMQAAAALAAAVGLLVAALVRRRLRLPAAALLGLVASVVSPRLSLLLVPAGATSFYQSPTRFSAASIVQGARLFPGHCAACHGARGHGDGHLAGTLAVPPADLTASHLWMHSDGELFGWLTDGIEAPRGGKAMPGFGGALSEDERWALIDYIRANNAGETLAAAGSWSPPLQVPAAMIRCGGRTETLGALHGRILRLHIGSDGASDVRIDIPLPLGAEAGPCVSDDPALAQALAVVAGSRSALPPGTEFLVDGEGWLRARQSPGAAGRWTDPAALSAAVRDLQAHPVCKAGPAMDMNMQM